MEQSELGQILSAVLVLFVVAGLGFVMRGDLASLGAVFIFSLIVIIVPVVVRGVAAYGLDASVEHRIWHVYRYGFRPKRHFKNEQPMGVYLPVIVSVLSLGLVKIMTLLTYETSALKHRAAKRFGFYSFTEMTDWHNGLIGVAGILSLFIVGIFGYVIGWEYLFKMASYYIFWNLIPISNLDGSQIFFGSKILWSVLGFVALIFVLFALVI